MHDHHTSRRTDEDIAHLRDRIDELDAELAALLERRALVAAQVQRLKPVGYFAGRDTERERRLVERMAEHAPRLGTERLAGIMAGVIHAGLDAAQEEAARARPRSGAAAPSTDHVDPHQTMVRTGEGVVTGQPEQRVVHGRPEDPRSPRGQ